MSSHCQSKTPQPTPGYICNYSQVTAEELAILTDNSTDTKWEKEREAECKAKCEEAKSQRVEEEQLEAEWKKRAEEEAQRRRVMEEEEAGKRREAGREDEEEPATPHKGPSRAGVSSWWVEWEQERQLQAVERYAEVHERAATTFQRMAEAVEQMAEVAERTANKWGLYREWAEWAEMRRREDLCEAKMAKFECAGGGWKRPQSEVAEDKNEEVDEGVEGDNEEEEEVGGEQEDREEQAMEE
ncbi:hypothetical protein M404DRAFT_26560 [Pisolithus tinctorius Marx 270]|uniref:Uncharacterized protein n=1 Tax=Pisolithus tinctorius Marx 270 TaxID=870435 RepID=A0A0C3P8W4_PISTI|nr:hypothetical protein M404DRAFT_26560 [Pisolithus tinctorius Marx 270]